MDIKEIQFTTVLEKSDNTYKLFEDTAFLKHSAYQSLFNGSIFRNCKFNTMDFSRCDFEASVFETVKIHNTNFFHAYFQTAICSDIIFDECHFETTQLSNVIFQHCHFKNCFLSSAILDKCDFQNCSFDFCEFTGANITLCKFHNCQFAHLTLGDCSFYQNIMVDNQYENVTINLDSLGQVFGIKKEDLVKFKYIFLGEDYGYANSKLIDKLSQIYEKKRWFFSKVIFKYNINEIDSFTLISELNKEIGKKIKNKEIIKKVDIDFILNIINELRKNNNLPFFSLYTSLLELKEILIDFAENYYKEIINILEEYISIITNIVKDMILTVFDNAEYLTSFDPYREIVFTLHYQSTTNLELYKIIEQTANLFVNAKVTLNDVKEGSIIEILKTAAICIFLFQLCLYGVNGCLIQITDIKARTSILKSKNLPKDYVNQAMLGKQRAPELLKNILDKLEPNVINSLVEILKTCSNLKVTDASMKEVDDENSHSEKH